MLSRINTVDLVGTISAIETIPGKTGDGREYVRGELELSVAAPGRKDMLVPVNFFSMKLTKEGKVSKIYTAIVGLVKGERVSIGAELEENKFWAQNSGQLIKTKRVVGKFFRTATSTDVDKAEFMFSGFVLSPLREKFDKDGKPTGFFITIAQSNYKENNLNVIEFSVSENRRDAIDFINREYTAYTSVRVGGQLDYDIRLVTVEEKPEFGDPSVRTYQNRISNLYIEKGFFVTEDSYDTESANKLIALYEEDDRTIAASTKTKEQAGEAASFSKPQEPKAGGYKLL